MECLYRQKDVLPLLDAADTEDVTGSVTACLFSCEVGNAATLVDNGDAVFVNVAVGHDVTFRTFADGDDMVGLPNSLAEFPGIYFRVEPVVVFWMTEKDQVVDGDDALDATLADTDGQFSRQSVVDLNTIALQVVDDALCAPKGFAEG